MSQNPKLSVALSCALLSGTASIAQQIGDRSIPPRSHDHALSSCGTIDVSDKSSPVTSLVSGTPWPSGIVHYNFDSAVSSANRTRMLNAMAVISATVNVTFVVRTTQTAYITIRNSSIVNVNSSSSIGRSGARQFLDIYNWTNQPIIIHEIMHALGMRHEQARPDRDDYVSINSDKIDPAYQFNFDIQPGTAAGPYDFLSLMHYTPFSFSLDGDRTVNVKSGYDVYWQYAIGRQTTISAGDAAALRTVYGGTTRPDYFQLQSPAHGAFIGNTTPTLTWNNSNGATDYRVQIGIDAFSITIIHDVIVNGTSYAVPEGVLAPNREYYWRITARNAKGETRAMPIPAYVFSTREAVPSVVYVDQSAPSNGDGVSWNSAFTSIMDAETVAFAASRSNPDGPPVELRVAGGVYRADSGVGNRYLYTPIDSGTHLKGGYAGRSALDPDARDVVAHETVITGDILGNDTSDPATRADNSYWLVYCQGATVPAILDGFTLRGAANDDDFGGAVLLDTGSLIVRNCRIEDNRSAYFAGGMSALFGSTLTVEDTILEGNKSFNAAATTDVAGGASVRFRSSGVFDRVRFLNNTSTTGSAISVYDSNVSVFNSLFAGNTSTGRTNGPSIEGGTVAVRHFTPGTTDLNLTNVTFASNTNPAGGTLFSAAGSASQRNVRNSILWSNAPALLTGDWDIGHSIVEGGWSGLGVLNTDPMFVNAGAGDYSLMPESPAIDEASAASLSPEHAFDLLGNLRTSGSAPDMGAFELVAAACPGDLNSDGLVDDADFVQFAGAYDILECSSGSMPANCPADLNGDELVDDADFVLFAAAYDALLCP
ncbi:MAG: hypothetical protein J0L78_06870 [Planctomycetes bacterium]|nr:hypothetical protein [Planctomycetota bacterium]